jgi:hypothetical protein
MAHFGLGLTTREAVEPDVRHLHFVALELRSLDHEMGRVLRRLALDDGIAQ